MDVARGHPGENATLPGAPQPQKAGAPSKLEEQRHDHVPLSKPIRRIAVVINPAAGQDRPILGVMNRVFHPARVDWDVFVTKGAGDARRFASAAAQSGYDAVAVYGGDGTVAEVAAGLLGHGVPLAVFPGGTANVMSYELGIPSDLAEACALVHSQEARVRRVDMGQIGNRHFLLRAGIGFEAAMVEGADRSLKDRLGPLAYALSALQALREPTIARYRLTLDAERIETAGMTCIIANSGSFGRGGLTLAPNISISDGLLDVLVVRKADLPSLLSVATSVIRGAEGAEPLQHWQARRIEVEVDPPQTVTVDGELLEELPLQARVLPQALRVLVPASAQPMS